MPEERYLGKRSYRVASGQRARRYAALATAALIWMAAPSWAQQPARAQDPLGPLILLLLVPLALIVFIALEIAIWVLAPAPLMAITRALERGRGRCLLLGLLAAAATLFILSILNQHQPAGKAAGPLLLGIVALGCLTGVSAVSALLGQGVLDLAGRSGSRALAVLLGSALLGLVVLFPIVGQVLGIYFLLVGLGGAIAALAGSTRARK